ncbi:MAG: helix-turn-helix transcriptional regulator [Aliarcobacter sp.]|jgi:transcriptional regulator with XRE-family HTH domain|nr:helix-turn-helix transcriptional regulator [Aliarcobacter sp.]MDX9901624.1 helix-turn-helix transcriptional regulator [Aliarcobacter sp.]
MLRYLDIEEKDFNTVYNQITENIKKMRKERNITQEELALNIGHSSASMISKIEAGLENKHYNIKQLFLISKVLEVPLSKLFEGID